MMKFVVDPSKCTLDKSCLDVCPTDAFREAEKTLLISRDECIGCAACLNICPVKAIYKEPNAPENVIEQNKDACKYNKAVRN